MSDGSTDGHRMTEETIATLECGEAIIRHLNDPSSAQLEAVMEVKMENLSKTQPDKGSTLVSLYQILSELKEGEEYAWQGIKNDMISVLNRDAKFRELFVSTAKRYRPSFEWVES